MVGLITVIQLIHYPAFHFIDSEKFVAFELKHVAQIKKMVIPVMVPELLTGLYLFILLNENILVWGLTLMLVSVWIHTVFISVPIHQKLMTGKDVTLISKLVRLNWMRTLLWWGRGLLLIILVLTL